jgi:peptide-methionine (R)-S-oxide reductase
MNLSRIRTLRFIAIAFLLGPLAVIGCDSHRAKSVAVGTPSTPAVANSASGGTPPPLPAPDTDGKIRLSEDAWRARLTPEQFKILRGSGTERPFSCHLWKISDTTGVYHCVGCDLALFDSADKFDSGTGWPSFTRPVASGRVLNRADNSHGMTRVENLCARCDGHLGHVFPDGPPPTGQRYCINGGALRFVPTVAPERP